MHPTPCPCERKLEINIRYCHDKATVPRVHQFPTVIRIVPVRKLETVWTLSFIYCCARLGSGLCENQFAKQW